MERKEFIVLTLISLLAIALRVWRIEQSPDVEWDEPIYVSVAGNLLENGKLEVRQEIGGTEPFLYHPPLYSLLLAGWFCLFGVGIAQARFLSVLFSVLTLPFLYLLVDRRKLPVFLVALDPWVIYTNRLVLMENSVIFLGVLSLYLFSRGKRTQSNSFFTYAGIVLGFSMLVKYTSVCFIIAILLYELLNRDGLTGSKRIISVVSVILIAYSIVMCQLFPNYFLKQQMVQLKRALGIYYSNGGFKLHSFIDAVVNSYSIFVGTILLFIFGLTSFTSKILKVFRGKRISIIVSWALVALVFFGVLRLRFPTYFIMFFIPLFVLASPIRREQRDLVLVLTLVLVIFNLNTWNQRFLEIDDTALRDTIEYVETRIPLDAVILTEQCIGTAIPQRYVELSHHHALGDIRKFNVTYIITYETFTQVALPYLEDDMRYFLEHNTTTIMKFKGFKLTTTIIQVRN